MRRFTIIMSLAVAFFAATKVYAAWPDSSVARVKAVALMRADLATPFTSLQGEERSSAYEEVCKMENPYYPACNYKEWTTSNNMGDL